MISTQPITHWPPPKVYKSRRNGTQNAAIGTLFPKPTLPSPHYVCCIPAKPKTYYAKKTFKFIIFTIGFLVYNE